MYEQCLLPDSRIASVWQI
jgi:hypothetical protein